MCLVAAAQMLSGLAPSFLEVRGQAQVTEAASSFALSLHTWHEARLYNSS